MNKAKEPHEAPGFVKVMKMFPYGHPAKLCHFSKTRTPDLSCEVLYSSVGRQNPAEKHLETQTLLLSWHVDKLHSFGEVAQKNFTDLVLPLLVPLSPEIWLSK